jgi:hypothetical protein
LLEHLTSISFFSRQQDCCPFSGACSHARADVVFSVCLIPFLHHHYVSTTNLTTPSALYSAIPHLMLRRNESEELARHFLSWFFQLSLKT